MTPEQRIAIADRESMEEWLVLEITRAEQAGDERRAARLRLERLKNALIGFEADTGRHTKASKK